MEIRWLEAFVAVAEELHFGRAAERLHMAQSPLSQVIRRLEREVGTPLFTRSTRSVALTGSGTALLPYAYRTLRTLGNALDAARSAEGEPTGSLSLGFSGVHNHLTLPKLTSGMRRRFPMIDLKLKGGVRTFDGSRMVANGELDASFVGILGPADPPLQVREMSRQHVGVVVPADHRLAHRGSIHVSELRNEPFIMGPIDGNSSMTVTALQVTQAAGFLPQITQAISDPFLVLSMVAAGVGVTLFSSEILPLMPESAVWLELQGEPVLFRHGITWSAENESVPLHAFLTVLDEVFPEDLFGPVVD